MPNSKDDQKDIKPAEAGTEVGPNGEGGSVSPPKTPLADYSIPKKEVTDKKKLTAAERKKLAELRKREKEEEKKRKEKPESSSDDESTEALKKKIKFYQDKAEAAEGEAYEAVKEKEKSEKMYQDQLAKRKNQAAELKEKLKVTLKEKKKDEDESEEEDDSQSDQLQSDDSESFESESSPELRKKGKKKREEITEADRRNSKVCAFDLCERQESCGFVHVKAGTVPKDYSNEHSPNYIYHRGDPEGETSERAKEGKEHGRERRSLPCPEDDCKGSCQKGCKRGDKGDEEIEEEIDKKSLSPNVLCNKNSPKPIDSPTYFSDSLRWGLKGPKGIRKLIHECDDLINDLDSDLVLARSGLMGFKRKKRSNNKEEVRELICDYDEFISSIESDLALARREL